MASERLHVSSWATTSGLFVLALLALGPVLFFAAFAMPTESLGTFTYDMGQSVFPLICPRGTPLGSCYLVRGLPALWSWLVWLPAAVSYGYVMRSAPIRLRVLVGVLIVIAIMALFQGIIHIAGWAQYIDAV